MKIELDGLENYDVSVISFPLDEAPIGTEEGTSILVPVILLPKGQEEEKQRILEIMTANQRELEEKAGSKLIKVIVKKK